MYSRKNRSSHCCGVSPGKAGVVIMSGMGGGPYSGRMSESGVGPVQGAAWRGAADLAAAREAGIGGLRGAEFGLDAAAVGVRVGGDLLRELQAFAVVVGPLVRVGLLAQFTLQAGVGLGGLAEGRDARVHVVVLLTQQGFGDVEAFVEQGVGGGVFHGDSLGGGLPGRRSVASGRRG